MSLLTEKLLENDTPLAAAARDKGKKLNNRNEFLKQNDLINVLDIQKDGFILGPERLYVGGENIRNLNRELEKKGYGELTLRPTNPFVKAMGDEFDELDSYEVNVINPGSTLYFAGDKASQFQTFWDETNAVGPYMPTDPFTGIGDKGLEELEEELEPVHDLPVIEQPRDNSCGSGIRGIGDEELTGYDLIEQYDESGIPERTMVKLKLPVKEDLRVMAAEDNPVTAMSRIKDEDTGLCNMSKTPGSSYVEKAENARKQGRVRSVEIEGLDEAVSNILEDHYEAMVDKRLERDDPATHLGWDFFVLDQNEMENYPEWVIDQTLNEDYRLENGDYLIFGEVNGSPGSGIDVVNQAYPEQDSALNLVNYGVSLSNSEEFEPGYPGIDGLGADDYRRIIVER